MNELQFRKSSYSGHDENCVEVAPIPTKFHKSSYSGQEPNCVEIAKVPAGAAIQDSKFPEAGHLIFPTAEWGALLEAVRVGEV